MQRSASAALSLLLVLVSVTGCVSNPVSVVHGNNPGWTRTPEEIWAPRTRNAVAQFNELARMQLGVTFQDPPAIMLVTDAAKVQETAKAIPRAIVVNFDNRDNSKSAYERALREPLRGYILALQQQLAMGQAGRVPQWLREGSADFLAYIAIDRIHFAEHTSKNWHLRNLYAVRNTKDIVTPEELMRAKEGKETRAEFREMAGIMATHLNEVTDQRFFAAWTSYFRRAAASDFDADVDFRSAFGFGLDDFANSLATKIAAMRAEKILHARLIPDASGYATVTDMSRFPLTSSNAVKGYEKYLTVASPKAFALSTRGAWSYVTDEAQAMDRALEICARSDPTGCRLYAVDDRVVYRPTDDYKPTIQVRMGSNNDHWWTTRVRSDVVPIVEKAAQQFAETLGSRFKITLRESVIIHVASNRDDFQRLLQEQLKLPPSAAAESQHIFTGISNNRGQIAIVFNAGGAVPTTESVSQLVLHELTHEIQAQLYRERRGFSVPKWMLEGTAELIAHDIGQTLPGLTSAMRTEWENKAWRFYLGTSNAVTPAELYEADHITWNNMVRERRTPYQGASLMAIYLQSKLGDGFYPAWAKYFQLANELGQQEEAAFKQSFGMGRAEFLEGYKLWRPLP